MFTLRVDQSERLILVKHYGAFIGAESVKVGTEILQQVVLSEDMRIFQDMRELTEASMVDSDRAYFAIEAGKLSGVSRLKIVRLIDPNNPVSTIIEQRRHIAKDVDKSAKNLFVVYSEAEARQFLQLPDSYIFHFQFKEFGV